MSARCRFCIAGPLGSLAGLEDLRRPAALLGDTAHPLGARRVDEDHQIAQIVPAGFEQDGRVEHDRPVSLAAGFSVDRLEEPAAHQR